MGGRGKVHSDHGGYPEVTTLPLGSMQRATSKEGPCPLLLPPVLQPRGAGSPHKFPFKDVSTTVRLVKETAGHLRSTPEEE